MRGRRALRACGVRDVANATGVACRSSKPRRAGTRARGLVNVRRHSPGVPAAVRGRRALRACGVRDVASRAHTVEAIWPAWIHVWVYDFPAAA